MDRLFCITFLSVILFITCGITGTPLDSLQNRLLGGNFVNNREKFPYQASLRFDHQHICGGIIYKSRYVITSANCVNLLSSPSQLEVFAGDLTLSGPNAHTQSIKAEEIVVHEQYNGPNDLEYNGPYDVAVIKLEKDFKFNNYVNKVDIWDEATSNGTKPSTLKCTVSGWGSVSWNGPFVENDLRAAEVLMFDAGYCEKIFDSRSFVSPQMVCAGGSRQSRNTCYGDSGGPLVCSGYLYGIAASEFKCDQEDYLPGIYTNATYYRDWIDGYSNAQLGLPSFVTTLLLLIASLYNVQREL